MPGLFALWAFGVGSNNPNPVSLVRRSNADSWNNICFDRIARIFQVSEYAVEYTPAVHAEDSSNVFANNDGRFKFLNRAKHLRPERTVVIVSISVSGN